jgi:hypothetical protein
MDENPAGSIEDLKMDSLVWRDANPISIKHIHLIDEEMNEHHPPEDANTIDILSPFSKKEQKIQCINYLNLHYKITEVTIVDCSNKTILSGK